MTESAITSTPGDRRRTLVTVGLALVMVVSAVSGLNVALPDLARDTGATQSQLQWIVDAYEIVFAGLLLTAGLLGDRYGRKRTLLLGLGVFGVAAAVAAVVDSPNALTWLRAVMGVGAAFVMPATLSTITTSFPEEERGRAVGIWAGLAGAGAIIGIFASGLLLEWFSWNSFFVLNAAAALVAAVMTVPFVPATRAARPPRLDGPGAVLSLVGVAALVYGIIEGPVQGWTDPVVVGGLVIGGCALVGFVLWELHTDEPMLDPRLFLLRGFGTGSATITVQFMAFFGFIFLAMQYLQLVAGYSPLEAGFAVLPFAVVMLPLSRQAPRIAERLGDNRVGAVGLVLMAVAMVVFTFLGVDLDYWVFAAGLVILGAGLALSTTPATTAIVSSLPAAQQGVASAVNDTSREFGITLGIAVLGSVANAQYRSGIAAAASGLPAAAASAAESSLAGAQAVAAQAGAGGADLAAAAAQAFVDALAAAATVAAVVLVVAAVFVFVRAPRRSPQPDPNSD